MVLNKKKSQIINLVFVKKCPPRPDQVLMGEFISQHLAVCLLPWDLSDANYYNRNPDVLNSNQCDSVITAIAQSSTYPQAHWRRVMNTQSHT